MRVTVFKTTQTHADSLLAAGVATLLAEAVQKATGEPGDAHVLIRSEGACFHIEAPDVDPEALADWHPAPGYPYIWDSGPDPRTLLPPTWPVLDYQKEREAAQRQRNLRQQSAKIRAGATEAMLEAGVSADGPSPFYQLATFMATMRRGWTGDRELAIWLSNNSALARQAGLRIMSQLFAPPEGFVNLSPSQMLTPASGKGVHRPKPDSTAPAAINAELVNPLETWMRIRGMFVSLLPFRSGDDFRVYCIVPGRVSLAALRTLHLRMLERGLWGSLRLDIHAVLELLRVLIKNSDVMADGVGGGIPIRGLRPADVIQAVSLTFYKSLGTAHALMHSAFFNIPSWFPLNEREDAAAYLDFIREAIGDENQSGCLGTLQEDNSGHIAILQAFRTWLTQGQLLQLLEFLAEYGQHSLARRGRNEYAREWSSQVLDAILLRGYYMQTNNIVRNPGFNSVARAIRNATIYAAGLSDSRREARYGLAQEWKQKIKGGPETFIPVLADFVQQYNWETAHRLEGKGHMVTTEDLDQVMSLIDEHGVELVGMLLLAYGFSRAPRTSADDVAQAVSDAVE